MRLEISCRDCQQETFFVANTWAEMEALAEGCDWMLNPPLCPVHNPEAQPRRIELVFHDVDPGTIDEHVDREHYRRKYFALMTQAGITDREAQLECIAEVLNRVKPISRTELSTVDYARMCQALEDWISIEGFTP